MGPNYVRPDVVTPDKWRIDYPKTADVANIRWWEQFGDPTLNRLIETALRENQDVRAAAARVDQFIGALVVTRSQFYPQLGYTVDVSRNRGALSGLAPVLAGTDQQYSLYQAALTSPWQIDLFGRIRRQSEAAPAQVLASDQGRRRVILSVVTSVAAAYIALLALDRQLEIARDSAKNYAATVQLFSLRFKGGVVSQVELEQTESLYQLALAAIPSLEQQIAIQENLISILVGRNPGPIPREKVLEDLVSPSIPADRMLCRLSRTWWRRMRTLGSRDPSTFLRSH